MLVEGFLFIGLGLVGLLLPLSAGYRQRLVDRLSELGRGPVPQRQRAALEAREARRARAGGVGILLTGFVILGMGLAGVGRGDVDGWFLLALMVVLATACLAIVEIRWPGTSAEGPRAARMTAPTLGDYLPPLVTKGYVVILTVGLLVAGGSLLLGRSQWFDAQTLLRGPLPVLVVGLVALAALTWLAVQRVLSTPQPAQDESDLYWHDVVRASTLSSLLVPPAVVALLGLLACGSALDDAASVAAERTGVGPVWTLVPLVAGYVVPLLLVIALLLLTTGRFGGTEVAHMRDRLWGGKVPGGAGEAAGADPVGDARASTGRTDRTGRS